MDLEELRLSALLSGAGLSQLPDLSGVAPVIAAGQMWRARWDDVVTTVFVDSLVGGFRNEVRVAPITIGADAADDKAIVVPSSYNALDVDLSIWPELVTDIAEIVLEQWIANVEQFRSLEALEQAASTGALQYGLPILNASGRRARDKRVLALVMEALANAARVLSGSGSLPELLINASVAVSLLASKVQVPTAHALRIMNGSAAVDLVQARLIAELVGVEPVEVLRANPSIEPELVRAVTARRIGAAARELALQQQVSSDEALVGIAQGTLALAARGSGETSVWAARVDYYLALRLGEWQ